MKNNIVKILLLLFSALSFCSTSADIPDTIVAVLVKTDNATFRQTPSPNAPKLVTDTYIPNNDYAPASSIYNWSNVPKEKNLERDIVNPIEGDCMTVLDAVEGWAKVIDYYNPDYAGWVSGQGLELVELPIASPTLEEYAEDLDKDFYGNKMFKLSGNYKGFFFGYTNNGLEVGTFRDGLMITFFVSEQDYSAECTDKVSGVRLEYNPKDNTYKLLYNQSRAGDYEIGFDVDKFSEEDIESIGEVLGNNWSAKSCFAYYHKPNKEGYNSFQRKYLPAKYIAK